MSVEKLRLIQVKAVTVGNLSALAALVAAALGSAVVALVGGAVFLLCLVVVLVVGVIAWRRFG